jgi:citrate lyase subunit beta / citryl-CoA lyase
VTSADGERPLESAASLLFVPASRPDRVPKAVASAAHQVIVDLEDAVAPRDKVEARRHLVALDPDRACLVRINAVGSPYHHDDLETVAALGWVSGVIVPKAHSVEQLAAVRSALRDDQALLPLVESAAGIIAVDDLAAVTGMGRLLFGSVDYLADVGVPSSPEVLAHPRSRLVVASAAAGLAPPVDGPTLELHDDDLLRREVLAAKRLGMGAKVCIHPSQVEVVNAAFAPSPEELAWARAVVDAADRDPGGVIVVDGTMVDAPVVLRARRLLGEP